MPDVVRQPVATPRGLIAIVVDFLDRLLGVRTPKLEPIPVRAAAKARAKR